MVMAKSKLSYEESRRQRMEENKKRMEALNLPLLAQALKKTPNSPKPSPMKRGGKPRTYEVQMVEVVAERVMIPRRCYATNRHRDMANRVYASDEARAAAMVKADELELSLGSDHPTFVKTMLQSHVTGGFWLGLQVSFCKNHLPKGEEIMTLIDEVGAEYPTIYLARKTGLSGGWKGFAVAHDLVDGDALVFQLIRPTTFKVYIIRVERPGQASSEEST
nr:B3 domain-containing protein At5g42700-like isoform X2 [Malus domestica]